MEIADIIVWLTPWPMTILKAPTKALMDGSRYGKIWLGSLKTSLILGGVFWERKTYRWCVKG